MNTVTFEAAERAVGQARFVKGSKRYLCPVCNEWHLSLKAGTKGAPFVAHCWTKGCEPFERIVSMASSGYTTEPPVARPARTPQTYQKATGTGLTVEQYAVAKQLPAFWLRDFWMLSDTTRDGVPAVAFPYTNWQPTAADRDIYKVHGSEDWDSSNVKDRWSLTATDTDPGRKWRAGAKNALYGQFQLAYNEVEYNQRAACIFIVEGESDTQTLTLLGYPVLGVNGKNSWKPEYSQHPLLQGRFVVVWQEPGAADFTQAIANSFPPGYVKYLPLEKYGYTGGDATPIKDASELWLRCLDENLGDETDARKTFDDCVRYWLYDAPYSMPNNLPKTTPELKAKLAQWGWPEAVANEITTPQVNVAFGDVGQMEIIDWLWTDRWPKRFGMLFGMPDVGKSVLTLDIAARVTTGRAMPDRPATTPPAYVLMLVSEDGINDTVRPRLVAAGADMAKVGFVLQTVIPVIDGQGIHRTAQPVELNRDLDLLKNTVLQMRERGQDVQLIVIDPASSYLGDIDGNKETQVRPLLLRLRDFAEELNICVIGLGHFNKNNEQAALHRLSGAGAWTAVPRFVWACVHEPHEEGADENTETDVRLLLNGKLNITAKQKKRGLRYDTTSVPVEIQGKQYPHPTVTWLGDADTTLVDVLDDGLHRHGPEPAQQNACKAWLANLLDSGKAIPCGSRDGSEPNTVYGMAKAAGLSERTLRKAKEQLRVKYWRDVSGVYMWAKADTPFGPQSAAQDKPY